MKIVAVVVTFNRKILLAECVEAIKKQTINVSEIIIIDNASTDGSRDFLKERVGLVGIDYRIMDNNLGGSGGFYEGIKASLSKECEFVWIMDDDTIPNPDCLAKLIEASHNLEAKSISKWSFLASTVYGISNEVMNVPTLDTSKEENGYSGWYRCLEKKMVRIQFATFVSLLLKKDAVEKCGLPCKDYFIWGDDIEYTKRLTSFYGPAFFVGDSVVLHKRFNAKSLDINNEDNPKRLKLYHHYYRNFYVNSKFYKMKKLPTIHSITSAIFKCISLRGKHKLLKAYQILKGTTEGVFQYFKYKSYILNQISTRETHGG